MIELITTVASVDQAKAMLAAGVDTIYFGEETFGLRLPYSFSRTEQQELVNLAHAAGKKAAIAVNGITTRLVGSEMCIRDRALCIPKR